MQNDNDILYHLGYSQESQEIVEDATTQARIYSKHHSTSESELGFLFDDSQELAEIESLMSSVHPEPHETNIVNQVDDLICAYEQYISDQDISSSEQDIENVTQFIESRNLNSTFRNSDRSVNRSDNEDAENINDYLNQNPNEMRGPSSMSILLSTLSLALVSILFTFVGYWAILQNTLPVVTGGLSIAVFIIIAVSSIVVYIQFNNEFTN